MHAAILFEPDGYLLTGPKLMGRQAAGAGFLRAAVAAHAGQPLMGYTPIRDSADAFMAAVRAIDPAAVARWIPAQRLDILQDIGVLYRPDHALGLNARLRLRRGPGAYSLCGVTHTLASSGSLEHIVDLLEAPVMPWDAVICTSQVAASLMRETLAAQAEYLGWRFGHPVTPQLPQLPVIPLGVHTADFETSPQARAAARARFGLGDDDVVALFAGRLSFNGKAHPFPMLSGLQAAAKATGRRVVLIQAGQFHNTAVEAAVKGAMPLYAPDVDCIFVDGSDPQAYGATWRAADLFVSLSDSIQETFGITPLEAMAAGLPVVVTDWNGYRDTVRDGIDGFRIATFAPQAGAGSAIAHDYEAGTTPYDHYLSRTSTAVSVDQAAVTDRLTQLVADPDLRRRLGEAGRARARGEFDWSNIYGRYQELWAELARLRPAGRVEAPASAPTFPDPFTAFAHYPTVRVGPQTRVTLRPDADLSRFELLTAQTLLSLWNPPKEVVAAILDKLSGGPATVADLGRAAGWGPVAATDLAVRLAKLDLLAFERDD